MVCLGCECSYSAIITAISGWVMGQVSFIESCFLLKCYSASLGRESQRHCHTAPVIPLNLDMKIDSRQEKENELSSSVVLNSECLYGVIKDVTRK